jgi:N-acetylneuraminate synthase
MKSKTPRHPLTVSGRPVGQDHPPLVIAELSGNHNGSLARALEIVDAAAGAGAHALKIQTYTADTMTLDIREREFLITDPSSPWHGRTLYDLYAEAHTPWDWHGPIFERAKQHGMIAFSTPFDASAVDFLESLDVPCYKIASFENTDLPLIERVAATGKPLIVSTGMATLGEIDALVRTARCAGRGGVALLKCTSSYPASPESSNVRTIPFLRQAFDCEVGLSDHTLGVGAAVASVALGATLIEKHFTLSRAEGGVDAAFSLEPLEMRMLVDETRRAWQALGEISFGAGECERGSRVFRRSLYFVRDLQKGAVIGPEDVRAIRPGLGLSPTAMQLVIGRTLRDSVARGSPVSWSVIL